MSSLAKVALFVMSGFLICGAASPLAHAQSGPLQNILQLNASGSYLGIQMEDVTAANMSKFKLNSERGVIVRSVVKGSPAEEAGLHEDDVILEYAGYQVWSATNFSRLVEETPPGRKVDLAISRDGKRITLSPKIATRSGRTTMGRAEMPPREGMDRGPLDRLLVVPPRPDQRGIVVPGEPAGKPRLGITLLPLSEQHAESLGVTGKKGVLVSSVNEGSPSAGKLRAGDVILSADGKEIREPEELTRIVREKSDGTLALKVIRDKKQISVEIALPSLPAPEGRGLKL
jgi:serine protease Do